MKFKDIWKDIVDHNLCVRCILFGHHFDWQYVLRDGTRVGTIYTCKRCGYSVVRTADD